MKNQDILKKTRELLSYIPDFERLFTKIVYKKATPNQLYQLTIGIEKTYQLCEFLNQEITMHKEVLNEILSAIDSTAPNTNNSDQPYILKNHNKELDEWKDFSKGIDRSIKNLELEYKKNQYQYIRIKNTPLGLLIEINNNHTSKLGVEFQLKQALKTASRFSTEKLNQLNIKYLQSENFIKNKKTRNIC